MSAAIPRRGRARARSQAHAGDDEDAFADASLVLFYTICTCVKGAGPDRLASFRFSRYKRGDRRQSNVAQLTSREGLPLGRWLYPGKQSDVNSMAEANREFRDRFGLGSFVVVADRGMASAAHLEAPRSEDARLRDAIVQQLEERIAAGGVRDQLTNGARRYLTLSGATEVIDL